VILHFTKRNLHPGMSILEMKGSIHAGPESARLEREVDGLIADGSRLIIFEMAGVTHADSAAIGAIVRCLAKLKKSGGGLRIAAAQSMIHHSLKLTKVDQLIHMFSTVDEAADGFSAPYAGAGPPEVA
jgi:anti-anti-sigma factor